MARVTERLAGCLGERLVAAWLAGSAARGDYEQGRSDLDVIAAVREPLDLATRGRIVAAVRHDALPCPARKLELVAHRAAALARGRPGVELNLETGPGGTVTPRVDEFWFVIDLSAVREQGVALAGPSAAAVVAEPARGHVLAALAASLAWHRRGDEPADDAVLNACRALRYLSDGRWYGKRRAGEWAAEHGHAPAELVRAALSLRAGRPGARPDADAVAAFLDSAYRLVAARIASSRPGRRNS